MTVSVKDFGAVGDGIADDSTAFQRAVDSDPEILYVPEGTYRAGNCNINTQINIEGEGSFSRIIPVDATCDVFRIKTPAACYFGNLSFEAFGVTRTAGAYIAVPSNGTNSNFRSVFSNLTMGGAFVGIDFVNADGWTVRNCYFANYRDRAISVANLVEPDSGDSTITASVFDAGSEKNAIAIAQWSSGGLRVVNNKFLHGAYHYLGQFNSAPRNTTILILDSNSFEWASAAAVAVNSVNATFGCVLINGNHFSVPNNAQGVLLQRPASGANYLTGVNIGNNLMNLCGTGARGITVNTGNNVLISPNNFIGAGTAVQFGSVGSAVMYTQMTAAGIVKVAGNTGNVKFV